MWGKVINKGDTTPAIRYVKGIEQLLDKDSHQEQTESDDVWVPLLDSNPRM